VVADEAASSGAASIELLGACDRVVHDQSGADPKVEDTEDADRDDGAHGHDIDKLDDEHDVDRDD